MAAENEIVKVILTYSDGSTEEIKDGYIAGFKKLEKAEEKIDTEIDIAMFGNMMETKNLIFFLDSVLQFAVKTGLDKMLQEFYASHAEEE